MTLAVRKRRVGVRGEDVLTQIRCVLFIMSAPVLLSRFGESWFAKNEQLFALRRRITFRHLYLSPDQRGEHVREAAMQAVITLAGKPGDWPEGPALGDPFMFQDRYVDRLFDEMAKLPRTV
jgi:hypothetical protein